MQSTVGSCHTVCYLIHLWGEFIVGWRWHLTLPSLFINKGYISLIVLSLKSSLHLFIQDTKIVKNTAKTSFFFIPKYRFCTGKNNMAESRHLWTSACVTVLIMAGFTAHFLQTNSTNVTHSYQSSSFLYTFYWLTYLKLTSFMVQSPYHKYFKY